MSVQSTYEHRTCVQCGIIQHITRFRRDTCIGCAVKPDVEKLYVELDVLASKWEQLAIIHRADAARCLLYKNYNSFSSYNARAAGLEQAAEDLRKLMEKA